MRPVRTCCGAALAVLFAATLLTPAGVAAQDATGRPKISTPDPAGRPRGPRRPRSGRPKKVIPAAPERDDRAATASVIIRSYPPGAEVFLDDRLVGTTADDGELELSGVRVGLHRIVLRKEGFREWAQTVTVASASDEKEIEPLLQAESPQYFRTAGKLPAIEPGREIAGQIGREGFPLRDGSGFYNEYMLRVSEPGAYLVTLRGSGMSPSLRIVDEGDQPYGVDRIGEGVYQSVVLPKPGNYYVQVSAPLAEGEYVAGDYTVKVVEERVARGESRLEIGATVNGALEPTDRSSGPDAYYDVWTFDAAGGERVRVVATSADFVPAVTLLFGGRAVSSSGKGGGGDGGSALSARLGPGRYTIYVRSASGGSLGSYQLAVTAQ